MIIERTLHRGDIMSFAEIGRQLGVSTQSAKSYFYRAMEKLQAWPEGLQLWVESVEREITQVDSDIYMEAEDE